MGGKTRTLQTAKKPSTTNRNNTCYDHDGKAYPSQKAMCEAFGVKLSTFRGRRNAGWDLKKALLTKLPDRKNS